MSSFFFDEIFKINLFVLHQGHFCQWHSNIQWIQGLRKFLALLSLKRISPYIFSRESDSSFTNVRSFVCQSQKPFNSLKSSSFIIYLSSFIILHYFSFILPSFRDFYAFQLVFWPLTWLCIHRNESLFLLLISK